MAKAFKNTFNTPQPVGSITYEILQQLKVEFETGQVLLTFDQYNGSDEIITSRRASFTLTAGQLSTLVGQVMTVARNRGAAPAGTDTEEDI